MNAEELYTKLVQILENEVGIYRHLLDMVRGEKDLLIAANVEGIAENNRAKELMITKLRAFERARGTVVEALLPLLKRTETAARLLDLAVWFGGDKGDKLRTIHATLDLMIKRIREYNNQNERLIQSALSTFEGSMNALRSSLAENKVYKKKGQSGEVQASAPSGQFISKEA